MKNKTHLSDYLQECQATGKFLFLKGEAAQALNISNAAILKSIQRLAHKKKIAFLKKSLYQILTPEYSHQGSLPPEWFVHDLMMHLKVPYYVGLLTAASFHGAAHQAPQTFQVICQQKIPTLTSGSIRIEFHYRKNLGDIPIQSFKTPAGYVQVSTPEETAFDLIRYLYQSGHLDHVATVLSKLAEVIKAVDLAKASEKRSIFLIQRLGYLLDRLNHDALTEEMYHLVSKKIKRYIPLRSDKSSAQGVRNKKWHIANLL